MSPQRQPPTVSPSPHLRVFSTRIPLAARGPICYGAFTVEQNPGAVNFHRQDGVRKFREIAVLCRLELAGFSFVAIFGALSSAGSSLPLWSAATLFANNILLVILGFAHNDFMDVDTDRAAGLAHRPLVAGTLSRYAALRVTTAAFVVNLCLAYAVFRSPRSTALLFAAQTLALLYNALSKRLPGSDVFYAASAALLCLYGAEASAAALPRMLPWGLTASVTGVMFFEHLFFNLVSGGRKDTDVDRATGARTLAANAALRDGRGTPATWFFALATLVKGAALGLIYVPVFAGLVPAGPAQVVCLSGLAGGALTVAVTLLRINPARRQRFLNYTRLQETLSKALLPVVLLGVIGPGWTAVILFTPVLWFGIFNQLLHRKWFSNPETF